MNRFFREKIIPEVKRAAIEINTTQAGFHARWDLFPNERFPQAIDLVLTGPRIRTENFLCFRVEPDDFNGGGISWYTSDNPICRKIEELKAEAVENLIVKFVGSVFNRATVMSAA